MFYSRMTPHALYSSTYTSDTVGYKYQTFTSLGTIPVYITVNDIVDNNTNDLAYRLYSYVGYTTSTTPKAGYRLDTNYMVEKVVPTKYGLTLYLSKIEDM